MFKTALLSESVLSVEPMRTTSPLVLELPCTHSKQQQMKVYLIMHHELSHILRILLGVVIVPSECWLVARSQTISFQARHNARKPHRGTLCYGPIISMHVKPPRKITTFPTACHHYHKIGSNETYGIPKKNGIAVKGNHT